MAKTWRSWTTKELRVLREQYRDNGPAPLMAALNRSYRAIETKASALGLRKYPDGSQTRSARSWRRQRDARRAAASP